MSGSGAGPIWINCVVWGHGEPGKIRTSALLLVLVFRPSVGRYEFVAHNNASAVRLDTKTGDIEMCMLTDTAKYRFTCGPELAEQTQ